ncbi:MAG: hypothetical protein ABIT58_08130 [Ferruginibacter sp.]
MTQKQIAESILKRYVELHAVEGYKLDYDWVKNHFKRKCKATEFGLIGAAIEDLISENLVEINYDDDSSALMLTKSGFQRIYKVDAEKAITKMTIDMMTLFRNQRSMPNHVLILTWLEQMLAHDFNPAELALLPDAIKQLTELGYIKKEDKNNFCIILTQQGYEAMQQPVNFKKAS